MKRFLMPGAALLFAGLLSYSLSHKPESLPAPAFQQEVVQAPEAESALGTKENPQARTDYELAMLRNPSSGKIPENIRKKELLFARELPQKPVARTKADEWQSAGPFNVGGRTRALVPDYTNEEIILSAGVSGGMWRSTNGGQNWTKTTDPLQLHSVTHVVQDPRPGHASEWYYGTGEIIGNSARGGDAPYRGDGIYRSTDNGLSWQEVPSTSTNIPEAFDQFFDYTFRLAIDPSNLNQTELYCAAAGGILRSTNGGESWEPVLADGAAFFTEVAIAPNGMLYATLSSSKFAEPENPVSGIFRSADGISWEEITPAGWPQEYDRIVVDINPQDPNEAYFLAHVEDEDPEFWYYDEGSWTDLSANIPAFGGRVGDLDLQGSYNMLVEIHPENEDIVFIGGTNLYRSTDGFRSTENTSWIGGYSNENDAGRYPGHHPDQHVLYFYQGDPNKALSGHDGGVSITQDIMAEEVNWNYLNNGYITSQFYTIGLDQTQPADDLILGGLQDNGSQIALNVNGESTNWSRILSGDGGYVHVAYKGSFIYMSFQESQIYRLTFNDNFQLTSFGRIDPPGAGQVEGQEYLFVNPYTFDPNNPNRMYLAAGDVVYRNRNVSQIPAGGQEPSSLNWQRLSTTRIAEGSISAIAISDEPADILYYGSTSGEVFRLNEANTNEPERIRLSSPDFPEEGYVAHIAINPFDADEIVVVFSNYEVRSIFHSNNGGQSFTDISANLEEFPDGSGSGPSVRHVELIPLTDGSRLLLAGTSTGLYSASLNDGNRIEWTQEAPETIGRVVVPQMRHRSLDGRVVIATHGNGVYFRDYANVQPNEGVISGGDLTLLNPYPNPFRREVIIGYTLPSEGPVRIRVYNVHGQRIRTLLYNQQFPGTSEISWDGTNASGDRMAPGTYFIRMEYGTEIITKRVVLLD